MSVADYLAWRESIAEERNKIALRAAKRAARHSSGGSREVAVQSPFLLESFDSSSGFVASGGATLTQDTTNKIQGAASLKLEGNGVSGQSPIATKTGIGTFDPAELGVIACSWYIPEGSERQVQSAAIQFGRSGTYSSLATGTSAKTFGIGVQSGRHWHAFDVSEVPSITDFGAGAFDLRVRITQNAPYHNIISADCLYRQAKGKPTIVLTFDDNEDTTIDIAYPYMSARNMRGTCYIAPSGASGVGVSDSMTLAELQALYSAGWDMSCDSTNDASFCSLASTAAAVADAQTVQSYLTTNGMPRASDHLCYPNGEYHISATPVQVAALTGNGTAVVTCASTTGITAGMTAFGYGIADGTTVVSNDSATQLTLSTTVAAQTKAASFIDRSGAFYMGKLPAAFSAAGFKTGRTTIGETVFTRFGFGDQAMAFPGNGVTGSTLAQMKAKVDECLLRGTSMIFYFHRITEAGGSINIATADFTGLIDYIETKRNARLLDVLTISEFWARDGAATVP